MKFEDFHFPSLTNLKLEFSLETNKDVSIINLYSTVTTDVDIVFYRSILTSCSIEKKEDKQRNHSSLLLMKW